jgi:signal transduction histidine kinase/ActR/RegA family two-component response regulator
MTGPLQRAFAGLRFRVLAVLTAGVLCAGVGFEVLLVTLTRGWLHQELDYRSRSTASLLAERSLGAFMAGDKPALQGEIEQTLASEDVVGAAIYGADGRLIAYSPGLPGLWAEAGPPPWGIRAKHAPLARPRRYDGHDLIEVTVPIVQRSPGVDPDAAGRDPAAARPAIRHQHVGWVRVVMLPDGLEESVRTTAELGLIVLVVALAIGLLGVWWLGRLVVRPLREASELAREIAAGRLDRRLPVHGNDELSQLAEAMNTVAAALLESHERVETESNALRTASRAVMAIARGTRTRRDPGAMFDVVATELKRVTGCDAAALAVPHEDDRMLQFTFFDPPAPWGGLNPGTPLDHDVVLNLRVPDGSGARLALDRDEDSLSHGLAGDGYRSAMIVPLMLESGPQAVLLLASKQLKAFPPGKADVVAGLATHLSAALHVALLNDQLRGAVAELQRTHEYLVESQMLRVVGEMATGVAHEFNNLLGSVLGRAQLLNLRIRTGKLTQEDLVSSLRVIERAALDGSEVGRRLRQFGRGGSTPEPKPVDLDGVLLDAIEFTRPRWENEAQVTGRHIEVASESWSGAHVMGHSNELREVFTNLILNAVDALPEGGTIRLATSLQGDRVLARVQDNGTGMDEETRKRLFEPFFTTKGESGSGLGLSVAYGILKRHGATIEVESEPGQGASIEILFPRAKEAPREDIAPAVPVPGGRSLRILVVDDDQTVREVLRDMLVALGHQVVEFGSGEEALRGYQAGLYDLILTDLGMPGVTGWKLAQTVRALDRTVTISLVTGWGSEVRPETLQRAGVDHVVSKPFTLEDVVAVTRLAAERDPSAPGADPEALDPAA